MIVDLLSVGPLDNLVARKENGPVGASSTTRPRFRTARGEQAADPILGRDHECAMTRPATASVGGLRLSDLRTKR